MADQPENDDETPDDVTPDVESSDDDLEGAKRPIRWRPGRRHGRSAESERRDDS